MRVFIADDHAIMRCGIRQVLRELGGFEVVGEASTGRQVLSAPDIDTWDVLVLDLSLPRVSGPEVLRRIKARRPDLPVVILSMYAEAQYAARMLAAGASAYVSKDKPPSALLAAVRAAARGERVAPAPAAAPEAARGAPPHAALTRRELQVFMLIAEGGAVSGIAAELDVHACTVSNHLARIREKLGVSTVADLVRYAHAAGLTDLGPRVAPA
jgi:two-component system, NarL family, invasion response regulator UvrY